MIAFALGGIYLYLYLRSPSSRVRLSFATRLEGRNFREILKVGAIASISSLQTVLTILVLTRIVASFGTEALAGYGIGTRLEFLLIPLTFAIGVACVPMVGMAIGSGMVQRARRVAWTGASLSAGIVGLLGLVAALWPDLWAASFTDNPQVLVYARSYLRWVAPCYAFFGFGPWVFETSGQVAAQWLPFYDHPLGAPLADGAYDAGTGVWTRRFAAGTNVTFDARTNKGHVAWATRL